MAFYLGSIVFAFFGLPLAFIALERACEWAMSSEPLVPARWFMAIVGVLAGLLVTTGIMKAIVATESEQ